jgi:hypothetical protein
VADGVREVEEELGVKVSMDKLVPLGKIYYCMTKPEMIDREIANVFLYRAEHTFDCYQLQPEEVSGIVRTKYSDFCALWTEDGQNEISVEGFVMDDQGNRSSVQQKVGKQDLVPHERSYYLKVIESINQVIAAS